MMKRKMLIFCTGTGAHQKLEAETSAEILGVSGIENARILRQ